MTSDSVDAGVPQVFTEGPVSLTVPDGAAADGFVPTMRAVAAGSSPSPALPSGKAYCARKSLSIARSMLQGRRACSRAACAWPKTAAGWQREAGRVHVEDELAVGALGGAENRDEAVDVLAGAPDEGHAGGVAEEVHHFGF